MSAKKHVVGTGGELLMHQLVAQGVEYAFTNTGSAEAGFFDAFLTVPGVQPILLLAESLVLSAARGCASPRAPRDSSMSATPERLFSTGCSRDRMPEHLS